MEIGSRLDVGYDVAENVADRGPEQRENDNHDYSYQNKDERVLHEALTLLLRSEQHEIHHLSLLEFPAYRLADLRGVWVASRAVSQ